jgi:uncharacterized protein (TIRG00374 family)
MHPMDQEERGDAREGPHADAIVGMNPRVDPPASGDPLGSAVSQHPPPPADPDTGRAAPHDTHGPARHEADSPSLSDPPSATAGPVPAEPTDPAGPTAKPRLHHRFLPLPRNVKIALMVLLLFFIGEYILLPELASARKQFHELTHLNVLWLVLGALLEVAALFAYAELTRTVLSPDAPDRFRIVRINMWALAVSHTLPGGTVPGTAASYRLLTEAGVSGSTAAFGLATQGIGSAVVLNIIFWLALLISIPLQGYNPLYGFAAILGVLLIAIFAAVVFLLTRGERQASVFVSKVANRLPFVRPETVTALVQKVADRMKILFTSSQLVTRGGLWAASNWLLDAASLWVFLLAFAGPVSPIDVLVAYGLANILAVIPVTPSGLGVIELTIIAVLKGFGVAGDAAAAGVLTWRLVNFWLPIPFGGLSYLSLRFRNVRAPAAKPLAS